MVNPKAAVALIGSAGYLTIGTISAALFGGYGIFHGTEDRLSISSAAAGSLSLSLHLLLLKSRLQNSSYFFSKHQYSKEQISGNLQF